VSRQDLQQKTVSGLQASDELGQVTWICQTTGCFQISIVFCLL